MQGLFADSNHLMSSLCDWCLWTVVPAAVKSDQPNIFKEALSSVVLVAFHILGKHEESDLQHLVAAVNTKIYKKSTSHQATADICKKG